MFVQLIQSKISSIRFFKPNCIQLELFIIWYNINNKYNIVINISNIVSHQYKKKFTIWVSTEKYYIIHQKKKTEKYYIVMDKWHNYTYSPKKKKMTQLYFNCWQGCWSAPSILSILFFLLFKKKSKKTLDDIWIGYKENVLFNSLIKGQTYIGQNTIMNVF